MNTHGKGIKILGAGISGLVAGIILSKNGYKVEVFEKRSRIGSFFEKSVHSFRNYIYDYDVIERYRQLGIEIPHIYPIFKELRFSPSLRHVEIYSENRPLFYNFIRGYKSDRSLDVELYELAMRTGVKFHFNHNSGDIEVDIVATGARTIKGIGYGEHYSAVSGIAPHSNYIFLDNRYSPNAYSCVLPYNNEASIVLCSSKDESLDELKKRFHHIRISNPIIKEITKDAKFENGVFGFVFYQSPKTAMINGRLYVGEAAGFLDAATAFGTHYAILSGCLAAKSIIEDKNYDSLWRDDFGKELEIQYLRRKELQKFTNQHYEETIQNLIDNCGSRISAEEYKLFKLSTYRDK